MKKINHGGTGKRPKDYDTRMYEQIAMAHVLIEKGYFINAPGAGEKGNLYSSYGKYNNNSDEGLIALRIMYYNRKDELENTKKTAKRGGIGSVLKKHHKEYNNMTEEIRNINNVLYRRGYRNSVYGDIFIHDPDEPKPDYELDERDITDEMKATQLAAANPEQAEETQVEDDEDWDVWVDEDSSGMTKEEYWALYKKGEDDLHSGGKSGTQLMNEIDELNQLESLYEAKFGSDLTEDKSVVKPPKAEPKPKKVDKPKAKPEREYYDDGNEYVIEGRMLTENQIKELKRDGWIEISRKGKLYRIEVD